ncbi:MAG: putative ABC transport system permease protein [Roseivirga sp.]|jgi:putative ABC transport system permease protein
MGTIVGVVKDFNYNKQNLKVEPLFMSKQPCAWSEVNGRLKGDKLQDGLQQIEVVWVSLFPQRPFE